MGKADLGQVHMHENAVHAPLATPMRILGEAGDEIAFIATGSMVKTAMTLAQRWQGVSVWSVPRLRPLASEEIDRCISSSKKIVTFEEHSIHGGLGTIVAERLAQSGAARSATLFSAGVDNRFSDLCGSYDYLMDRHELSAEKLQTRLRAFLGSEAQSL
jgi:transketolase